MQLAIESFNRRFGRWSITFPAEQLAERRRGSIRQEGWNIQYLFGTDERGEYLDYYAAHRMTDDSHVRLRSSGEAEELPAIEGWCVTSDDPTEARARENAHLGRNREVVTILEAKGFSITTNGALRSGTAIAPLEQG